MIVVADAGPILHLYWIDGASWALPPQDIFVVDQVWPEIEKFAPAARRTPGWSKPPLRRARRWMQSD
ncbi:MAG: hypothetical protein IPG45_18190 [Deltaproteobacteria bacterium]|nr:hypothetical protein [Deltaproteobacteria bacterium]